MVFVHYGGQASNVNESLSVLPVTERAEEQGKCVNAQASPNGPPDSPRAHSKHPPPAVERAFKETTT